MRKSTPCFDGMPYYLEMELRFLANMDWAWLVWDGMPELEAEVLCADALRRAVEMTKMALGIEERGVGGGEVDGIGASGSPHISMMEMENILGGEMGDGRWCPRWPNGRPNGCWNIRQKRTSNGVLDQRAWAGWKESR